MSSTGRSSRLEIENVILHNLHYRRPKVVGASLDALPQDPDFSTNPLPDRHFDCHPFQELFKDFEFEPVRDCLNQVSRITEPKPIQASFWLRSEVMPYLELDGKTVKKAPPCVSKVFSRIPVPREVFFQSTDEGKTLGCYSSRIRSSKAGVFVDFSLIEVPSNREELNYLLASWALLPFWDEKGVIDPTIAPEGICQQCMEKENVLTDPTQLPKPWPGPVEHSD